MHIISLHDLCRQELIHLLNARFMPTGWTRNGDRKAQQLHSKAQRWLANAFAGVPDALVARPNSRVCSQLHATAIAEHKLERMVYRMVELFAALQHLYRAALGQKSRDKSPGSNYAHTLTSSSPSAHCAAA